MAIATPLRHRPAGERFLSRNDWLESWHSFSFGGHDDPSWRGFGPLRVINDDRIAAGRGFGLHPHRDMDIITVMVEGQLNHQDSLGSSGRLIAGDVQAMAAGTGIHHSEVNGGASPCRLLQIWIEPAASNLPPPLRPDFDASGGDLDAPGGTGGARIRPLDLTADPSLASTAEGWPVPNAACAGSRPGLDPGDRRRAQPAKPRIGRPHAPQERRRPWLHTCSAAGAGGHGR